MHCMTVSATRQRTIRLGLAMRCKGRRDVSSKRRRTDGKQTERESARRKKGKRDGENERERDGRRMRSIEKGRGGGGGGR